MRNRPDSILLSLDGGGVEIRLSLDVLARWQGVGAADVRTLLLAVAGAAAMGQHAEPGLMAQMPEPVPPKPDDAGLEAALRARVRPKRKATSG